jgi:hypothetical protein
MRFVKVQYDTHNQQFTVMDHELATQLDDGSLYLVADFTSEDFLPPAAEVDPVGANHTAA